MALIKQHLSELIERTRDIVMSCGRWRTPPPRPFALNNTHFHRRRAQTRFCLQVSANAAVTRDVIVRAPMRERVFGAR
jgi:hypothetical protein